MHSHVLRTQGHDSWWRKHARWLFQFCTSGRSTYSARRGHGTRAHGACGWSIRCAAHATHVPPPDPTRTRVSPTAQAVVTAPVSPRERVKGAHLCRAPLGRPRGTRVFACSSGRVTACLAVVASPLSSERPDMFLFNISAMSGAESRTYRIPTVAEQISRTSSFFKTETFCSLNINLHSPRAVGRFISHHLQCWPLRGLPATEGVTQGF